MEEKTKFQIEQEKKEKKAVERENKILAVAAPITGVAALVIGTLGFVLTLNKGELGITIFYAIMFVLGLVGVLYGVIVLVRKKNPNFLRKKKPEEKEDMVLED